MNGSFISRMLIVSRMSIVATLLGTLTLAGCGGELGAAGLSGTYVGKHGSFIEKLVFTSGNKAEVDYGIATMAGTYVIEGKTVKVTLAMGVMYTFTVDAKGCLVGSDQTIGSILCKQSKAKLSDVGSARPRVARTPIANTKANEYVASMRSDLRNLVTAEEAYFADSVKYSATTSCTTPPAAGTVNFCVTTGNTLGTIGLAPRNQGWSVTITNTNLQVPLVTCAIFINTATLAPAVNEGAPGCQ